MGGEGGWGGQPMQVIELMHRPPQSAAGPKISFTLSYEGRLVSNREHSSFKGKEEKVWKK